MRDGAEERQTDPLLFLQAKSGSEGGGERVNMRELSAVNEFLKIKFDVVFVSDC